MALRKIRLGDYIVRSTANNKDLIYGTDLILGVNNEGNIVRPRGDVEGVDLLPYKIVKNGAFVYNPSRLNIGSIARFEGELGIVSHLYIIFYLNDLGKKIIDPDWLYIYFRRKEFQREVDFRNFGSQRPEFSFDKMSDIEILLPDIESQRKFAAIYLALIENQQSNERGLNDLRLVCEGYIEELRRNNSSEEISRYSSLKTDCRNKESKCNVVRGVKVTKELAETKADIDENTDLENYKLVNPGEIVYVPNTARMSDKFACGLSSEYCCVSPIYEIIQVNKEKLIPEYLFMWFRRPEFDRYARFNSWGSVREILDWETLGSFSIPIPPINVQKSIVEVYNCYIERKTTSEKLKQLIERICPILIKGSVEEAREQ